MKRRAWKQTSLLDDSGAQMHHTWEDRYVCNESDMVMRSMVGYQSNGANSFTMYDNRAGGRGYYNEPIRFDRDERQSGPPRHEVDSWPRNERYVGEDHC